MTTLARSLALSSLACLALFGCGDDDSDSEPQLRPTVDGGSAPQPTAGSSSLDETAVGEDLTNPEVEALCATLDQNIGLVGDIDAACQAEAWLATTLEADCDQIVGLCTEAGFTMLSLELPSPCATLGMPLTGCTATVSEMIDCAVEVGAFWAARTCAQDHLFDVGPECSDQLAQVCPVLYGEPAPDGTAGTGAPPPPGCNGLSISCPLQGRQAQCEAIAGCTWTAAESTCDGLSTPCSDFSSDATCGAQPGCAWTP